VAVIHGNGLKYREDISAQWITPEGVTETTRSIYELWVADRIVALVSVVNTDPELRIQIGKPDADETGDWHVSEGRAEKNLHPIFDENGIPEGLHEHVDGVTVQRYVYPRMAAILANMYVPKSA
jgi:hypothetical protein